MAEGRRRQVEGHRDGRRRDGVNVFQQDIDKAENRVGRQSVRRGERPHAVKGAVQDAVAVKTSIFSTLAFLSQLPIFSSSSILPAHPFVKAKGRADLCIYKPLLLCYNNRDT